MSKTGADYSRFRNLRYDDFRRMAKDPALSRYEKVGFPDSYRANRESDIFSDICCKLPQLRERKQRVLDIGPGCSDLPHMLIKLCAEREHELVLIDSSEMLEQLEAGQYRKIAAQFPHECPDFLEEEAGSFNAIIVYSVLHYILPGADIFAFFDRLCSLLGPEGTLLIGDIPNISMRKRFFASETGKRFHRDFTNSEESPQVLFNVLDHDCIDRLRTYRIAIACSLRGFSCLFSSPVPFFTDGQQARRPPYSSPIGWNHHAENSQIDNSRR